MMLAPNSYTSRVNFAFIDVFDFFLNIGSSALRYPEADSNSPYYVNRHEYNKLWVAYSNLQAELFEERKKVTKLQHIRMTEPSPNTSLVLAEVLSRRNGSIVINRGSQNGIKPGQYVLGDNAIIGAVAEVTATIASVETITSSNCRMHIKISDTESDVYYNGTIEGNGAGKGRIFNVPKKYKIKVGFNVYAAKKPGILEFPRLIGRVSKCVVDESNPVVWDITVTPAYDIANITDVAVVVINTETN